jgi:hypothetical protein
MTQLTQIYVTPGFSRWYVNQIGEDKALAEFPEKNAAVNYAIVLAKNKDYAHVKIIDEAGEVASEQCFVMQEPQ